MFYTHNIVDAISSAPLGGSSIRHCLDSGASNGLEHEVLEGDFVIGEIPMRLAGGNSSKGWLTSSDEVLGPLGATFDNLVSLGRAAVAGVHGTFDSKGVTSIFPPLPSLPGTIENPFSKGMTIFTAWTNYCPYLSDSEHLLFRKYIRHSSALKNQSKVHASHNYYAASDNTTSNNSTPSMRYLGQIDAAFDHFFPILETYVRHFSMFSPLELRQVWVGSNGPRAFLLSLNRWFQNTPSSIGPEIEIFKCESGSVNAEGTIGNRSTEHVLQSVQEGEASHSALPRLLSSQALSDLLRKGPIKPTEVERANLKLAPHKRAPQRDFHTDWFLETDLLHTSPSFDSCCYAWVFGVYHSSDPSVRVATLVFPTDSKEAVHLQTC